MQAKGLGVIPFDFTRTIGTVHRYLRNRIAQSLTLVITLRTRMMRKVLATSLLVGLAVASPLAQPRLILIVKDTKIAPNGRMVVTLQSGTQITIPRTDIDNRMMERLQQDMQPDRVSGPIPPPYPTAQVPTLDVAMPKIRAKCAAEWSTDSNNQRYCQDQQRGAIQKLAARNMSYRADHSKIRTQCQKEWSGDFNMQNYCEEQQLKAHAEIGK